MKKNCTHLFALLLLFSVTANAQGPWNFNGTADGFVANNFSGITAPVVGDTYITYNIGATAINPNLENTSAGINTTNKFIAITMQNNTANTRLQVITNRTTTSFKTTNFDRIIANDPGFTTYYIDMTANAGWTGTLNELSFRFKLNSAGASPLAGTIFIDKIEIVATKPVPPSRIDYTFDSTINAEGFIGENGVTLSQPTAGEIDLAIAATSPFPKFTQNGTYSVDGSIYKYAKITLINNSPKSKINFAAPGTPNQFSGKTITPNSTTPQTVYIDLSALTNWTAGVQSSWFFQIIEPDADPLLSPILSAGTVKIQQILFTDTDTDPSLGVNDIVKKDDKSILVYPNPVKDVFSVSAPFAIEKMEVYNVIGQQQKVQSNGQNGVDVSSLSNGVYFIKIYQDNATVSTKRFIKE